jgi:hypothetical protein
MFHPVSWTGWMNHLVLWPEDDSQRVETCKGKGKTIPLQAWTDPEGSRRLRLSDLRQSAHEGGKVVSPMHRLPLIPGP